jgi:SAM-dependent methyltransferase
MHWKVKCLAHYALAYLPFGAAAHRFAQRRVTGRYLPRLGPQDIGPYLFHVENFRRAGISSKSTALEFGGGANLVTPLLLSAAGAQRVLVYDLHRLATVAQVNDAIRQLREQGAESCNSPAWPSITDLTADLAGRYRIDYRAPADARRTGLAAESVALVYSTSTLEHIPPSQIRPILRECRRVLQSNGMMSFIVDYHDHYSSADLSITRFNFLRYEDWAWKWFNPPNHFQNRLRHSDYEQLFAESGLVPIETRHIIPAGSIEELERVPISAAFHRYSPEDLAGLNGFFLLGLHTPSSDNHLERSAVVT